MDLNASDETLKQFWHNLNDKDDSWRDDSSPSAVDAHERGGMTIG
jgi:hypothetical protein